MNEPQDLDRRLDDWLADGSSIAPERAIGSALDHARRHPRRRDPLAVMRRDPMGSAGSAAARRTVTLVAAAALLLAAGLAVATVGGLFDTPQPWSSRPSPARRRRRRWRHRASASPVPSPVASLACRHPGRSHRRHRWAGLRRGHGPIGDARHGPLGPAVRRQRGRHRHRRGQPAERSGVGRADVGRLPVRHPPRPDDRSGRTDHDARSSLSARATRSASPGCSS